MERWKLRLGLDTAARGSGLARKVGGHELTAPAEEAGSLHGVGEVAAYRLRVSVVVVMFGFLLVRESQLEGRTGNGREHHES